MTIDPYQLLDQAISGLPPKAQQAVTALQQALKNPSVTNNRELYREIKALSDVVQEDNGLVATLVEFGRYAAGRISPLAAQLLDGEYQRVRNQSITQSERTGQLLEAIVRKHPEVDQVIALRNKVAPYVASLKSAITNVRDAKRVGIEETTKEGRIYDVPIIGWIASRIAKQPRKDSLLFALGTGLSVLGMYGWTKRCPQLPDVGEPLSSYEQLQPTRDVPTIDDPEIKKLRQGIRERTNNVKTRLLELTTMIGDGEREDFEKIVSAASTAYEDLRNVVSHVASNQGGVMNKRHYKKEHEKRKKPLTDRLNDRIELNSVSQRLPGENEGVRWGELISAQPTPERTALLSRMAFGEAHTKVAELYDSFNVYVSTLDIIQESAPQRSWLKNALSLGALVTGTYLTLRKGWKLFGSSTEQKLLEDTGLGAVEEEVVPRGKNPLGKMAVLVTPLLTYLACIGIPTAYETLGDYILHREAELREEEAKLNKKFENGYNGLIQFIQTEESQLKELERRCPTNPKLNQLKKKLKTMKIKLKMLKEKIL